VDGGLSGTRLDPLGIRVRGKEGDAVGDRAGEELIVPHHHAEHCPVTIESEPAERRTVDRDLAGRRLHQACQDLQKRGLAATRGTHDGDGIAGLEAEGDAVEHQRIVGTIAKASPRTSMPTGRWPARATA
jgi:hypothetical protein